MTFPPIRGKPQVFAGTLTAYAETEIPHQLQTPALGQSGTTQDRGTPFALTL